MMNDCARPLRSASERERDSRDSTGRVARGSELLKRAATRPTIRASDDRGSYLICHRQTIGSGLRSFV